MRHALGVCAALAAVGCRAHGGLSEPAPAAPYRSVIAAARHDTIENDAVRIQGLDLGQATPGPDTLRAVVSNKGPAPLVIGLDLRAVPGLWLRLNWERSYAFAVAAGATRRIAAPYEFRRLTPGGRLRVTFTAVPGALAATLSARLADSANVPVDLEHPMFQRWYDVGTGNPAATDPRRRMVERRTGHLDLYAYRGSLAAGRLAEIAAQRERAIAAISALLAVDFRDTIRLVFYPDSATKTSETGHIGMGWASNGTIVEIYNAGQRLNPYHEIAHVVAAKLGDPPAFLNEGFATYVSERLGSNALEHLSPYGPTVRGAACAILGRGLAIPLDKLFRFNEIGSDSTRPAVAYPEAAAVVQYLISTYGVERFRQLYRTLRGTDDAAIAGENEAAFGAIVGEDVAGFERDWRADLSCPAN